MWMYFDHFYLPLSSFIPPPSFVSPSSYRSSHPTLCLFVVWVFVTHWVELSCLHGHGVGVIYWVLSQCLLCHWGKWPLPLQLPFTTDCSSRQGGAFWASLPSVQECWPALSCSSLVQVATAVVCSPVQWPCQVPKTAFQRWGISWNRSQQ